MSEQHIQTTVRAFIVESYLFGEDDPDLTEDTSLLESGVVDSTGILELVSFIESTYGFRLPDEDMLPENLDSIERIAAYVSRRTGGK
jgi:acyl carrier protein